MESREGSLTFGKEHGEPFRLDIRVDVQGHRHLTLFQGEQRVERLLKPSLDLLQYFLENPHERLLKTDIENALNVDDVTKSLSLLRGGLGGNASDDRFIVRHPLGGYEFVCDVSSEGDLGIECYPRWRPSIFYDLLSKVTRGSQEDKEDLRIATVGFSSSMQDLALDRLLKKGARIRIIMMNPENDALMKARHALRTDSINAAKSKTQINEQIEELRQIVRSALASKSQGSLELRLSDAMPSAFIAHTRRRAVFGLFLAQGSYVMGPLVDVKAKTETYDKLHEDWTARWTHAKPIALLPK